MQLSATTSGINDVKEVVKVARNKQMIFKRKTILFVDEIHRFNNSTSALIQLWYKIDRYLVVFSDYLTRWPEAFAVPSIEAPVIAKLFLNEIYRPSWRSKNLTVRPRSKFYVKIDPRSMSVS